MKRKVFETTPEVALKFLNIIAQLKEEGFEDSVELRMTVLNELMANGEMTRVYETSRTKEQLTEDFKKHGFKVIEPQGEEINEN